MKVKLIIVSVIFVSTIALLAFGVDTTGNKPEVNDSLDDSIPKKVDRKAALELISIINKLKLATTVDAEFEVSLTDNMGKSDFGTFKGRFLKDSEFLYISSFNSENLITPDMLIAVDHSDKAIYFEKTERNSGVQDGLLNLGGMLFPIDSLVNLEDSMIVFSQLSKGMASLNVLMGYSSYSSMDIIYHYDSKIIDRIILYPYQEIFLDDDEGEIGNDMFSSGGFDRPSQDEIPDRIVISYTKMKLGESINRKVFDYKRYFTFINNQPKPNSKFKNYEIDSE